jgi:hypothetical protein
MSQRLGIILIGLGLLLWGLHIQSKYEGFQQNAVSNIVATATQVMNSATPPSGTAPATLPITNPIVVSNTPGPIIVNADPSVNPGNLVATANSDPDLSMKDYEIRSKFKLVNKNKVSTDVTLTKYLADTDELSKIAILFNEVKDYTQHNLDIQGTIVRGSETDANILRQLIYTAHNEVSILYKIYYIIPSLVISTGTSISADTAGNSSVLDEEVLAKSIVMIRSELAGIPTVTEQLGSVSSILILNATTLQTDKTDTNVSLLQKSLNKFIRIVDMGINEYDYKIQNITIANLPAKLTNTINNKISFLGNNIKVLQEVLGILNKVPDLNSAITANINTRIASYNSQLTSTQNTQKKEGFQSYSNPYNNPSPNLKQAYEFRLNKNTYVNDIFSTLKFW